VDAEPGAEERAAYELELGEPLPTMRRGTGCNFCANTGFLGRIGVFEALVLNDEIRRLMLSGATANVIRERAIADGMVPMRRDGMLKVKLGLVTPAEIVRSVYSID
jgi:general secretion pathway protein E